MQFYFNEIKGLVIWCCMSFQHVSRGANWMADSLAKQRADRLCNLSVFIA